MTRSVTRFSSGLVEVQEERRFLAQALQEGGRGRRVRSHAVRAAASTRPRSRAAARIGARTRASSRAWFVPWAALGCRAWAASPRSTAPSRTQVFASARKALGWPNLHSGAVRGIRPPRGPPWAGLPVATPGRSPRTRPSAGPPRASTSTAHPAPRARCPAGSLLPGTGAPRPGSRAAAAAPSPRIRRGTRGAGPGCPAARGRASGRHRPRPARGLVPPASAPPSWPSPWYRYRSRDSWRGCWRYCRPPPERAYYPCWGSRASGVRREWDTWR